VCYLDAQVVGEVEHQAGMASDSTQVFRAHPGKMACDKHCSVECDYNLRVQATFVEAAAAAAAVLDNHNLTFFPPLDDAVGSNRRAVADMDRRTLDVQVLCDA
jgi:hypothetical protein